MVIPQEGDKNLSTISWRGVFCLIIDLNAFKCQFKVELCVQKVLKFTLKNLN